MIGPRTADEYVELVRQALFEIDELRMSAEYDMEYMSGAMEFIVELEKGVRDLYASMERGDYRFGEQDLPFMLLVEQQDDRLLPFKHLLRVINETHRKGLDTGED